jgi:nitrile hydratase
MAGTVDGIHDMGGMHGFGAVDAEHNQDTFHADWEKRVPGLATAAYRASAMNIDEFRHGIERMPPRDYLAASYYERHLFTIELNLIEKGFLTREEIDARMRQLEQQAEKTARLEDPELARQIIAARLESQPLPPFDASRARFKPGDRVVTRNIHPRGHTRLPRYGRGKHGVVDCLHGVETLPDASAHGRGPAAEPLYSVRFDARELWGSSAEGNGSVNIDLWESYLEPEADRSPT